MATMAYPFTQDQANAASEAWGCNCGPTALAFALQLPLEAARFAIRDFETRRYTSPSMMRAALRELGRDFSNIEPAPYRPGQRVDVEPMFDPRPALVRIQWTGPWTAPGANPKWAYRQTHWITTWTERGLPLIFDVNCGIIGIDQWEEAIVPVLTALYPRADGNWFPTHIWRIQKAVAT